MRSITINGTEFKAIKFRFLDESEIQDGILAHDLSDEYHNGDIIIGNCASLPTDEEEAEDLLADTAATTYWELGADGIYQINA